MDLDTGAPTDKLTDIAIDYCKNHGSDVTTVSEFLEKKDEKLMKAIQDGIDRYNATAISRAQKVLYVVFWNCFQNVLFFIWGKRS